MSELFPFCNLQCHPTLGKALCEALGVMAGGSEVGHKDAQRMISVPRSLVSGEDVCRQHACNELESVSLR